MTARSPTDMAAQDATDAHLRTYLRTHEQYPARPALEPKVDTAHVLANLESLMAWQTLGNDERARGRAALEAVLAQRLRAGPWRVSKRMAHITATR